jgi:hypothetical protein
VNLVAEVKRFTPAHNHLLTIHYRRHFLQLASLFFTLLVSGQQSSLDSKSA